MLLTTWMLAACVGVASTAPFGTVVKTVSAPVKTVSVTHEAVRPPDGPVTVVKGHDANRFLDETGSSLATAVGDVFTNLGTLLSQLIRNGVTAHKVVVQKPVKKVVLHQPPSTTVEVVPPLTVTKGKTVIVN